MAQHAMSEGVRNIMKLEHMALIQYSVKKVLMVFGERRDPSCHQEDEIDGYHGRH